MPKREAAALGIAAIVLVVVLPVCNMLPAGSPLAVSNFTLNLFGKFLTYAILALGLDLLWGYAGVLSLGHGVFFGLGAYAMGMHLMLEIGSKSVYQSALPDFMVWNQVKELPLFWKPFYSGAFTLAAVVLVPGLFALAFGFLVSAVLAGIAGALDAPQVGIVTPAKIGVLPSIEMVVWVAAGGRGTLVGAVGGAFGVNWMQSWLTTSYPDVWLLFLGGLFMGVVLFFPDGVAGAIRAGATSVAWLLRRSRALSGTGHPRPEPASRSPLP